MGRIKKAAGLKHEATLSPALAEFVSNAIKQPLIELPSHLRSFPFQWPYPRGDLYHWIPLLDLFDTILEDFIQEYGLHEGPQTRPFGTNLLRRDIVRAGELTHDRSCSADQIEASGFSSDGDQELVEVILAFSRVLLENCGNRSLYASSERLGFLLNTVSLPLLLTTLRLASRLAIRCHHSRQRGSPTNQQLSNALLANHYNIDLEHVQKIAESGLLNDTFVSSRTTKHASKMVPKEKEKPSATVDSKCDPANTCDMLFAARADKNSAWETNDSKLMDRPGMIFSYPTSMSHFNNESAAIALPNAIDGGNPPMQSLTKHSNMQWHSNEHDSQEVTSVINANSIVETSIEKNSSVSSIFISQITIKSSTLESILASRLPEIPKDFHYDFLNQLRTTKYMTESLRSRQGIIATRIIALTNLAYVYPESTFEQKILRPDSDEPKRIQLVQQLTELIHPPDSDNAAIPLYLKTIALGGLEALSKHKARASDVCSALSVNVSHGILLFILRKTATELASDSTEDDTVDHNDWQEALLSLLDTLPAAAARTADSLVGAGLLDILVDVLKLRTSRAERIHHKVLSFLNSLVHNVRDAFQSFVSAKGLDAISDLIAWEVSSSIARVEEGNGLPEHFKSRITDYQMPYFQQQTLRWLFKFVNHMMTHGSANFDRLLRNLIDSPPLLTGLRDVLANGKVFGSTIWSGAVNILSSFIHNEPTSYAVIAEAGLSKSFLQAVSPDMIGKKPSTLPELNGTQPTVVRKSDQQDTVVVATLPSEEGKQGYGSEFVLKLTNASESPVAQGILPATDAISAIPSAFGAICLNTTGLALFLGSGALGNFFEIFESPSHVKSMAAEANLPKNLGQHFDELVRHHPRLKSAIVQSVVIMCARLGSHCDLKTRHRDSGAQILTQSDTAIVKDRGSSDGDDIRMEGSSSSSPNKDKTEDEDGPNISVYIGVAAKFLSGFFDNPSLCSSFILSGGLQFLLDVATSPSLPYNFNNLPESQDLSGILHSLVDCKPHLVLPPLVSRTIDVLDILEPLILHNGEQAFFNHCTQEPSTQDKIDALAASELSGTTILKALVSVHTLCNILQEAFMAVPFGARNHHTLFSHVNLTDSYLRLSTSLGRLYRICVWEEILLQNGLSDELKESTRVRGYGMGSDEADEVFGFINHNNEGSLSRDDGTSNLLEDANSLTHRIDTGSTEVEMRSEIHRKNVRTIRFLLSQVPSSITPFLQGLGRSLISRRKNEPYQRQNAFIVADKLASVALDHLLFAPPNNCKDRKDRFAYWIVALTSLSQLLIEAPLERPHAQCLTLVLQAFRNHHGLSQVNGMLKTFFEVVQELTNENGIDTKETNSMGLLSCLYGGMKLILTLYGQITSAKYIAESTQSQALATPGGERSSAYHFNTAQFLIELRISVVKAVQPIWDSPTVDGSSSSILKCIVEILRTILEADQEHGSMTSESKAVQRSAPEYRRFTISDRASLLQGGSISQSLAQEAVYRCYNNKDAAEEYCDVQLRRIGIPSLPIPHYDIDVDSNLQGVSQQTANQPSTSTLSKPDDNNISDIQAQISSNTHIEQLAESNARPLHISDTDSTQQNENGTVQYGTAPETDIVADNIDNLLTLGESTQIDNNSSRSIRLSIPAPFKVASFANSTVTVDELDNIRSGLRKNFIDRILNILSAHDDLSFDLADLIVTAASKASEANKLRKEIGETLVQSLISYQFKEDFRPKGKTIAAYANLLAIVIQEKDFYETAVDEIKDNIEALMNFIKIFPDQAGDENSPWVAQVLLVIEKLLAEDVQPTQIKWTPPTSNTLETDESIAQIDAVLISTDEKLRLFSLILDILPRIGKDHSLALSVLRVLVILTRDPKIATRLGEKKNLHRLFVVPKQLAGLTSEKFQSTFLLVLRHIMEDEETIRRVIRSEIKGSFQNRPSRPVDTTVYVRTMHAFVLRAPDLFLEATNDLLKLESFDHSARSQSLVLKDKDLLSQDEKDKDGNDSETHVANFEGLIPSDKVAQLSTDLNDGSGDTMKPSEAIYSVNKYSDGVVHYLLSQLTSYKDVDDQNLQNENMELGSENPASGNEMEGLATVLSSEDLSIESHTDVKKFEKPEFKAEHHPIYVYRCFLLQCLTELLMSYSRAKIEFLNFSRKAESRSSTPSKPRSGVLSYILHSLIPTNTLERSDSVTFRKAIGTSNWAMSTIVALCLRTNETFLNTKKSDTLDESEPDLIYVQKFVLENVLRILKDANLSNEPVGAKYGRLLSLADLMSRLLNGKVIPISPVHAHEPQNHTIREIAKIMFEKNFISALTNSIADIDLAYPNSKRAIKYILRPLRTLTHMAVELSESSELTSVSTSVDEDEIESATSMSEDGDRREETPDLFRHSTLGILDPGSRDDETSSESGDEDEDMYDDEYDDGIEYDEEMERDNDEVISDEDEELGDAEPIEGLSGEVDMDVEVVLDDDDATDDELSEDSDEMDEGEVEIIDGDDGDDDDELSDPEGNVWPDEDGGNDEDSDLDGPYSINTIPIDFPLDHHENPQLAREGGAVGELVLDIPSGESPSSGPPLTNLELDVEGSRYMGGFEIDPNHEDDDVDEDDDEDDEIDDEDLIDPGFDDDNDGDDSSPWGFGVEDDQTRRSSRPNTHTHTRRLMNPWSIFAPADRAFRTHRGATGSRSQDDGRNPLLQRTGPAYQNTRRPTPQIVESTGSMNDLFHLLGSRHRHDGVVSLLNGMMTTVGVPPPFGAAPHGALHLHLDPGGGLLPFPRDLQALLGSTRPTAEHVRSSREDSPFIPAFLPTSTPARWSEEARLLFGPAYNDKTQRIVNSLLKLLVPAALREEQQRKEKAEELQKQRERDEQQRLEQLEKEKAEKDAQEIKEREEREAVNSTVPNREIDQETGTPNGADSMEGVEPTTAARNEGTAANASEPSNGQMNEPPRVRAVFRGREVDITHLGIDLGYLDALPEELREEVLMQQLAEQRSQAAVTGEPPTGVDREFLDALPPDIRQEIIQQEAQEQRRREREESRRQAAANGGQPVARAEEMDAASFLASLDPGLRNAVLLDQNEDMLSQLPASIAAEARALGAERVSHRWGHTSRAQTGVPPDGSSNQESGAGPSKRPPRRQIVQMLDKPGVATLLRLLFVSQQGSSNDYLHAILENASRNSKNRAEILTILLSILQEGSSDASAVDRSFNQLSLRAKQSSNSKIPQSLKRSSSNVLPTPLAPEATPIIAIQQCLSALVHLTEANTHVPGFFLSEHDQQIGFRLKANKKGKAKENRDSRFAINTLLNLLDRRLITDSSHCMEQLASLMQSISRPLMMYRREMDNWRDSVQASAQVEQPVLETNIAQSGQGETDPVTSATTAGAEAVPANISTGNEKAPLKDSNRGDLPKRLRNFEMPIIPDKNYRLIVSVLGARECSSKTFRDTLSTINNLSTIPGAKEVFGRELVKVSQQLGDTIAKDLDLLNSQLQGPTSSDDVHGMALSKFSPSSSNQAKFLRVLTALDYLFDPSRTKTKVASIGSKAESMDNPVAILYESPTFTPLWNKLSESLQFMRQRENMLNTATVLLPLVEALMVVCKNSTLAEIESSAKDMNVASPASESEMKKLFFRFTEEHRKILNDLVRNNPRLMSGTFSLLVKNPQVLEFDNKRNYFTRQLHSRADLRHTQPSLQLSIRRDQTFLDSYRSLYFKTPEEMKYGKLSIRFHGEEGVDAGGVTREWFQTMSRQMFNPNYYLFNPVDSDRTTFHPNRLSHVNEEHLFYFKFIGRVIGKALYEGRALDCHFSRAVYKRILGRTVSVKDMETLDLEYYKSLLWMLENDISDIITETFSIETEDFGVPEVIELVPNGRNIPVTQENKNEYVQLVVEYRLTGSVQSQLEEFLKGFHDIVPASLISIFNEQELELLISGLPDIDVDDWKNNTEYHNYSASSAQIQWFWRAVRSFDKEEQAKLLQFVTGTAKVPLNGFKELEGMNGFSRFNIHRDYGNKNRLPSSHTCFNQLDLPEYDDYESLRKQLYTAMTAGSEYFGFA